uniref:Uncharacterized protein n=1 Tax=Aegilops tauschii subsp. strangulata TaxID=200361 RepID=A0A453LH48_AEGTS
MFVSGVKSLAPAVLVDRWWWPLPAQVLAAAPSPVLFLLLNVLVACIVVVSVQPA